MRKTIFGIQAASCTRGETLERRNYTRAHVGVRVRAGTRTRPAFDCILRIYSGRQVYARRARFAFSSFFLSFFFSFLFSLFAFPFLRARAHALVGPLSRQFLDTFIDSLKRMISILEFMAFHFWRGQNPHRYARTSENVWKSGCSRINVNWTCLRYEIYATKFALQWSPSAVPSSFIQHYGSHCDDILPYPTVIQWSPRVHRKRWLNLFRQIIFRRRRQKNYI